jgi:uncharacterized protein (DUF1800 family)
MTKAWVARAGIRAGTEDLARIERDEWKGWVASQLAMPSGDGAAVRDYLSTQKLHIEYEAEQGFSALNEDRAFVTLDKPIAKLWYLADWDKKMSWEERVRPAHETIAATLARAALSDAQLCEHVTDFWRDHFSVNSESQEAAAIALPAYDRLLREHAFGNFRELLEAVATSTAMLEYLNNASSKASPANENYARELFELHTLGAHAYLNDSYDRWREVPGALNGSAEGYIDQDVYEAARAFTGWSYASGQYVSEGFDLPKTGEFHYVDSWHDPYQKRILAREFDAYQPPLGDGRKVLDLVAFHPATARNIAFKLCQRFVSDAPSPDLVASVADTFSSHAHDSHQLAKTVEAVLLSPEFAEALPRLQRPLFFLGSLQRSAGVALPPDPNREYELQNMGQRLYSWHTPAGHPAHSAYWQSPGLLVRRWRTVTGLWEKIIAHMPEREWAGIADFAREWSQTLGAGEIATQRTAQLMQREFGEDERKVSFSKDDRWVVSQALGFLSVTPNSQMV